MANFNLVAGGRTGDRESQGAERDRLFNFSKALYRGYALHGQMAADRRIPVFAPRPRPQPRRYD